MALSGGTWGAPWSMVTGLWASLSPGSHGLDMLGVRQMKLEFFAGEKQEQLMYELNYLTSLSWVCDQLWKV